MGSYLNVRFAVVKRNATGTEITKSVFHGSRKKKKKVTVARRLQKCQLMVTKHERDRE